MPSHDPPSKEELKIVFVVVDVQRKFTGGAVSDEGMKETIETINKVSEMFRDNGRPVIFVHYDGESKCSMYGKSDGDEFLEGIVKDPRDAVVHKIHMNSFQETKLADAVRECGCDSVLIAGMVTQYCVLGTYFGAFEHDISSYLLRGGTIATEDRLNEAAYSLCKTFTVEEIRENLQTTKVPGSMNICGLDYPRPPPAGG